MSVLKTTFVPQVTTLERGWDPVAEKLGMNRTYEEGESAVDETIAALARLGLPAEMLGSIAFAIVGEDIPEAELRDSLRQNYATEPVELGRVAMRALDGGYTQLWAAAAKRADHS